MIRKALVFPRVGYHQHPVFGDDVRAERDISRRFADGQAEVRLEPLPVLVDEIHDRGRSAARFGGEPRKRIVERLFGRVEQLVTLERAQARGFVGRDSGFDRRGHRTGTSSKNPRKASLKASGASAFATCPAPGDFDEPRAGNAGGDLLRERARRDRVVLSARDQYRNANRGQHAVIVSGPGRLRRREVTRQRFARHLLDRLAHALAAEDRASRRDRCAKIAMSPASRAAAAMPSAYLLPSG